MDNFKVQGSKPYPIGTEVIGNDVHIAAINDTNLEMGIILNNLDTGKKTKISFDKGNRVGDVVSMLIKDIDFKKYSYTYYRGNKEFVDPFAAKILGNEVYGITDYKKNLSGGFDDEIFDWSSDKKLNIPYNKNLNIEIQKRSNTNRILLLKINNHEFKGTDIYNKLSLRSTDFTIELEGDTVSITTKGYGHGVGMSQYGALGMAKVGYTYDAILKHYYQNTQIVKLDNISYHKS